MPKRKQNRPLPGFPRKGKFKTLEEVEAYFATEKIQCLLCGKWFDSIGGSHFLRMHEISVDDYREMFGLPWTRGLLGRRLREKRIRIGKKLWREGVGPDITNTLRGVIKRKHRSLPSYHKESFTKRILSVQRPGRIYRREHIQAVLNRMRNEQRSLADVCCDPDMPTSPVVDDYTNNYPDLEEELKRTYYSLPPTLQVRSGCISPGLEKACQRLLAGGMGLVKIAKALGLSFDATKGILQRGPEGLRLLEEEGPTRWRDEDFERLLDRMRIEHRTVAQVCGDPDLPSNPVYVRYVRKHPEFKDKVKQTYSGLPYPVQARGLSLPPRFSIDCQRLRAAGMRGKKIGRALGVTFDPVRRALEAAPGGFRPFIEIGSSKWHPEAYEALLARMVKEQRTLRDVCGDPDLPAISSWNAFKRKHPEFEEKFRQAVFSQPNHMQISAGVVSPGLLRKYRRLRAKGLTYKAISKKLGIKPTAAVTLDRKTRMMEH